MVLRRIPENTCRRLRARRAVQSRCHKAQAQAVVGLFHHATNPTVKGSTNGWQVHKPTDSKHYPPKECSCARILPRFRLHRACPSSPQIFTRYGNASL